MDPNDGIQLLEDLAELHAAGDIHGALTLASVGGSPRQIPVPEIISGSRASQLTDVYQAGCILYHLYEGVSPYGAANERLEHLHRPVPVAMKAPSHVGALIAEMMSKDPSRRPTVRQALDRIGGVEPEVDLIPLAAVDFDSDVELDSPPRRRFDTSVVRSINATQVLAQIKQHSRRTPPAWTVLTLAALIALGVVQAQPNQVALVPSLVGLHVTDAQKVADDFVVRTLEVDGGGVPGTVVGQHPRATEVRARGTNVELRVTKGLPQIPVPETKGMTFEEASTALISVGLAVKGAAFERGAADPGRTIKTEPPAATVVDAGTPILIVIAH